MTSPPKRAAGVALAALVGWVLVFGAPSATNGESTLRLVGFAVPKAGNHAVQQEFARTGAGRGSTWRESYGPSGEQSRAVAGGLPADYVHFSIASDVDRLAEAGLVEDDWDAGPHRGMVTDSAVVLVVREGNPQGITGWADLARDDVDIVTPNPGSSGAARWNVLAAWLHVTGAGGSDEEAERFLGDVLDNVVALPGSGRDATTTFQGGTGDVLLSYENEAILARQNGEAIDYVVPDDTLLIENPGAVTRDAPPLAREFLEFARSPEGQAAYASVGFRPLRTVDDVPIGRVDGANDPANPFPAPSRLHTMDDLGGWAEANARFFDDDGIITRLLAGGERS